MLWSNVVMFQVDCREVVVDRRNVVVNCRDVLVDRRDVLNVCRECSEFCVYPGLGFASVPPANELRANGQNPLKWVESNS
jgi:hypothetical protein